MKSRARHHYKYVYRLVRLPPSPSTSLLVLPDSEAVAAAAASVAAVGSLKVKLALGPSFSGAVDAAPNRLPNENPEPGEAPAELPPNILGDWVAAAVPAPLPLLPLGLGVAGPLTAGLGVAGWAGCAGEVAAAGADLAGETTARPWENDQGNRSKGIQSN